MVILKCGGGYGGDVILKCGDGYDDDVIHCAWHPDALFVSVV